MSSVTTTPDNFRETLQQWHRFIRSASHVLVGHPNLLFQQAANEPEQSVSATAAALRWQSAKERRPWLQRINKPLKGDNCILTLVGHSSTPFAEDLKWRSRAAIRCCRFAPDGRLIVSASEDGTLRLWDSGTGEEIAVLHGHSHSVTSCVFSPGGDQIFSAAADGRLFLWDAKTGEPTFIIGSTPYWMNACAISADGRIVVTGGRSLIMWEVETGAPIVLDGTSVDATITSCAFSRDGSKLATASKFRRVEVWDVARRQRLLSLEEHSKWVKCCDYSPDGRYLVSASDDATLILWDAETGEKLKTFIGHSDAVQGCAFSPDGRRIVSASVDRTLKIWDSESGVEIGTLIGHSGIVTACAYSPDGCLVVSASDDNTLKVWDVAQLDNSTPVEDSVRILSCAYSPDYRRIISASLDGMLKSWDANTVKAVSKFGQPSAAITVPVYSPCGERIASTYEYENYSVRIWEPQSFEVISSLRHADRVLDCSWSPDGRYLLSSAIERLLDGVVAVWDPENGTRRKSLRHKSRTATGRYSPDGRRVVSSCFDGTLRIWDSQTGIELKTLKGHTDVAWCATFSPNGLFIASVSVDKTVRLWDARSGKELTVMSGHNDTMRFCSFSPDGRWLVSISNDHSLRIWDLLTFKTLASYADAVVTDWGPAGRVLACGTYSGGIHLLRLLGVDPGPAQITLTNLYRWNSHAYDSIPTARCEQCGKRFEAGLEVLSAIQEITQEAGLLQEQSPCAELPLKAWQDPRLRSSCPHCNTELRINPFIVDNRQVKS